MRPSPPSTWIGDLWRDGFFPFRASPKPRTDSFSEAPAGPIGAGGHGQSFDAALYFASGEGRLPAPGPRTGEDPFPRGAPGGRFRARTGRVSSWRRVELLLDGLLLCDEGQEKVAAEPQASEAEDPSAAWCWPPDRPDHPSSRSHIQEQSFQANFRGVELENLYEVGLAIASTLDLDELGEQVLLRAVSLLDARRGALYLLRRRWQRLPACYRLTSRFGGDALSGVRDSTRSTDLHGMLAGEWTTGGRRDWIPGAALPAWPRPSRSRASPRGLLVVADKESRHGVGPFPIPPIAGLSSLFANQAAIALENAKLHRLALEKERLEREMELAAEIQQQMLAGGRCPPSRATR